MILEFESSNGDKITLGEYPYKLVNRLSSETTEADNQYQKSPYQDGSTHIDTLLEEMVLAYDLNLLASNKEELEERKEYLCKVMNPKNQVGILTRIIGDKVRTVEVVSDFVPTFAFGQFNRSPNRQKCLIQFTAPNPYWVDPIPEENSLSAFRPLFTFPFEFPIELGEQGDTATFTNNGHVVAPIEISFHGPAINPEVRNGTTGEFIRVRRELFMGDILHINTADGRDRRVEIELVDGTIQNAFHYIDVFESSMFKMALGANELTYRATGGTGSSDVTVKFYEHYVY